MITILTDELPGGMVGSSFDFTMQAMVDPLEEIDWTVSDNFPADLSLNQKTGQITGISRTEFFASVTFTATTKSGEKDTKPLILNIKKNKMENLVGSVIAYAGHITEGKEAELRDKGWLMCKGQELKKDEYLTLWNEIGYLYGKGKFDDLDIFYLPNYEGQFLRGIAGSLKQDPDISSRKAQDNEGGDPGSAKPEQVGSFQQDAFKIHTHEIKKWGRSFKGDDSDGKPFVDTGWERGFTESQGESTETRPKNVYVHYLIRLKE